MECDDGDADNKPKGQSSSSSSGVNLNTKTSPEMKTPFNFKTIGAEMLRQNKLMDEVYTLSRDITFESKGIITLLHKFKEVTFKHPPPTKDHKDYLWSKILERVETLRKGPFLKLFMLVKNFKKSEEYKLHNPLSHCLQEFIEALALLKFIQYQKLIRIEEVQAVLTFSTIDADGQKGVPEIIPVSQKDFMLGVADLTGELMRMVPSITSHPDYNVSAKEFFMKVLEMTQQLYQELLAVSPHRQELEMKLEVMRENVLKMESALCDLRIREEELLAHPPLLRAILMKHFPNKPTPN